MADTYSVSRHDPKTDTDDDIAEALAIEHALEAEIFPDDPPTPLEQALSHARSYPDRFRRFAVRARDAGGRLVGTAGTGFDPEHDTNPEVFRVGLGVLPEHRRRGVGTRLLAELVEIAEEEGRTRLLGNAADAVPAGAAFAERFGGEARTREHINHLPVAAVDRALLAAWVAQGPQRAPAYEMIGFDGPAPDDLLEPFSRLILVMNTAPRDDLDLADFESSPELLREYQAQIAASGAEQWVLVARHVASGELAGFHDVMWNPASPGVVWVGATGVEPAHRGHALGKWLKASMMLRILDERPTVRDVRTGNADSNDAMLAINHAMGYRPFAAVATWEVSVGSAREVLARA